MARPSKGGNRPGRPATERSRNALSQIPPYSMAVSAVLIEAREDLGLTGRQVARAVGKSASAWSLIERGLSPITVEILARVSPILKTSPSRILMRAERDMRETRADERPERPAPNPA